MLHKTATNSYPNDTICIMICVTTLCARWTIRIMLLHIIVIKTKVMYETRWYFELLRSLLVSINLTETRVHLSQYVNRCTRSINKRRKCIRMLYVQDFVGCEQRGPSTLDSALALIKHTMHETFVYMRKQLGNLTQVHYLISIMSNKTCKRTWVL